LINVGAWIATDESHDETSGKLCRRTRRASAAADSLPEVNPASAEVLAEVPLSPAEEIAAAAEAGLKAFAGWGRRLAGERIQLLFERKTRLRSSKATTCSPPNRRAN
jgi:acyl-CoA reductase-like NAD-dependent aldehyde dehydrogenase